MTTPPNGKSTPATQLLSENDLVRAVLADDYEVLEELGRGGMAIVYRAREKALDREVALKVLPARLVIDKGFVERFEHEARTAAKLEHPNIVPIYRVGRAGPAGEVIYFVMKLLRGQSLSEVLGERGTLGAPDVRRILMETAAALGYAAKRGVVHRDIKPDNIMLDNEGRCVITDFGIAKSPGGQTTAAGTSLGTPRYMSPEHAMGLPLDGRSDMYALGIVAWRCLFGTTPFDADDPLAVLYKHIHEPLPQLPLASDDERQLYDVIARMLAKKPDDRFQSGNELIAALGGQISDPTLLAAAMNSPGLMAPTEVIPSPRRSPVWGQFSRKGRRWSIAIGTVAAVAIAGWVTGWALGNGTGRPPVAANPGPAPVVPAPPVVMAPTGPSPRAAAIIEYNKLASKCPKRDTVARSKAIEYAVRLDSVRDRERSDSMVVVYDVCGLSQSDPFTAEFTLSKLRQIGLGQQKRHRETTLGTAGSPRSRERMTLDTREMSAGSYRLDVLIIDAKKREARASREFRISEKK